VNILIQKETEVANSGVFKGGLVRGPLLWPDRRDFCNYFGIIFSAV